MSHCSCQTTKRNSGLRRVLAWVHCLVPGILLTLVPKCPLCVMAYAAMFTGLGLSFTAASYVRVGMIVVCVAALVYLVGRQYVKRRQH